MRLVNQTTTKLEIGICIGAVKTKHFILSSTLDLLENVDVIHIDEFDQESWDERKKKFPDKFIEDKAKFLNMTMVAGVRKERWECNHCGTRFNLIPKKQRHECKSCGLFLLLEK